MIHLKFFLSVLLLSTAANASILLGSGFSSATAGRIIPSISLGYSGDSMDLQFSSTGVQTTAYYHSSYRLSTYWNWKAGDFLFGDMEAGFGAGVLYAVRGFKSTSTQLDTKSDYVLGPTFFVRWILYGPFYIAVDGLYGILGPSNRNGDLLGLNARDDVNFVVGFKL